VIDQGEGQAGRAEKILGGVGVWVANEISKRTGKDTRALVLGHLQRGGSPTTCDRLLALRFGATAVRLVEEENYDHMVALSGDDMVAVPLEAAISQRKKVPRDGDRVRTALEIGICMGVAKAELPF
jgi:6-phosphofructokinase 1